MLLATLDGKRSGLIIFYDFSSLLTARKKKNKCGVIESQVFSISIFCQGKNLKNISWNLFSS